MATVLYVEGSEGIGSLRAKLQHADDTQVVLVASGKARKLRDSVWLKLLHRTAQQRALDLALVTRDRSLRHQAQAQGIAVYSSIPQVKRHWLHGLGELRTPDGLPFTRREPRFSVMSIAAAVLGTVLVMLVAVVAGSLVLPSATISIVPYSEVISLPVELSATTERKTLSIREAKIPARAIELRMDLSDQMPTSGRRLGAADRATGQVTLANRTALSVSVPKGSRFGVPSGPQFFTLEQVTLPATQWSTARVGVVAAEPGSLGNVSAQAIGQVTEPALLQLVSVVNESATGGGTDSWINYVTAEDRNRVKARMIEKARQEAYARLLATKSEAESLFVETATLVILEELYDRSVGDDASSVSLRLKVMVRSLAYSVAAANEVASNALAERVPPGMQLVPGSFEVASLEPAGWDESSVSLRIQAEGRVVPSVEGDAVRQAVLGMSPSQAEQYISQHYRLAEKPQIGLAPSWVTTIPLLPARVEVRVRGDGKP